MSKRKQTAVDEMPERSLPWAPLILPVHFSCDMSSFIRLPEIQYYIIFVIYMSE